MRRIYAIYVLQRVLHPTLLKVYILGGAFLALVSYVSISNIFANAPGNDIGAWYNFTLTAFLNTELIVQGIAGSMALAAIFLMKDLFLLPYRRFA